MLFFYPGRIEFCSVDFFRGRKSGEPKEKSSEQVENQQQTQQACGTGPESNPGYVSGIDLNEARFSLENTLPVVSRFGYYVTLRTEDLDLYH